MKKSVGFLKSFLWGGILFLFINTFVFALYTIPSESMKPTLLVGDRVLVLKYRYGYSRYSPFIPVPWPEGKIFSSPPNRGDIVVFTPPGDQNGTYIKRVIGLPGDRIQMQKGRLIVNEKPVSTKPLENDAYEEFLENTPSHTILKESKGIFDDTGEFLVPNNHVFVMGDNRDNSIDSRSTLGPVGFVPFENLKGKAVFIAFSLDPAISLFSNQWNEKIRSRAFKPI